MKKMFILMSLFAATLLLHTEGSAQGFLKKLKDKAENAADKVVDKKIDKKVDETVGNDNNANASGQNSPEGMSSSGKGRPANKTGEGLKNSTPPDINQQINDAVTAQSAGNYSQARFAVQQALLGVELQMGREILRSLPATVADLPKDTTQDRVASSQWGWSNLTIQRTYSKGDKQLDVVIGNNSMYSGYMNLLFAGNYAESNGQTQNFKRIQVRGNNAVIKFEQNEGYTVLVQLGQTGMMTFNAVNFANEQEVMNAVNSFDIDHVKKMMGQK